MAATVIAPFKKIWVGEDLIPAAEGLVGRDGNAAVFIAPGDQFEEDAGLGLILVGTSDFVEVKEDQETLQWRVSPTNKVERVERGQGRLENEITARGLKSLHQIAGPGVEDAVARLDQRMPPSLIAGQSVGRQVIALRSPDGQLPGNGWRTGCASCHESDLGRNFPHSCM